MTSTVAEETHTEGKRKHITEDMAWTETYDGESGRDEIRTRAYV
jgi:hypothetical protein